MKIGNPAERLANAASAASTTAVRGANDQAKGQQVHGGQGHGGQQAGATVQLSSAANALLEGADGGFDAAKVKQVRDAIAGGTYKVNAEAIADKLISNAKELLSGKSS
jgi:negative regulator of flagellin synthesis FlgM